MTATAAPLAEVARSEAALRMFLRGLPRVDQAGTDRRAAALSTRSITGPARAWAVDLAIRMVDLTALEGADTRGRIRALCAKARTPDPSDPTCPPVAAACLYPALVPVAAAELGGSGVRIASVATAFPAGLVPLPVKLAETAEAVAAGADEIDMVINRSAFLAGRYQQVYQEIEAVRSTCGDAVLKVILETGELVTYDNVRQATWLAMLAGADFVKTSTGKIKPAATAPVLLTMLESVRSWHTLTGRFVGVKAAGGIRTTPAAVRFLVLVNEIAGEEWLRPDRFRFGASALLDDLVSQRRRLALDHRPDPDPAARS